MKDRGIIMTPDNIVAIDEGRKGMTRRLVKPQPPSNKYQYKGGIGKGWHEWLTDPRHGHWLRHCVKTPYAVGQLLYIREKWAAHKNWDGYPPSKLSDNAEIWFANHLGWDLDKARGRVRSSIHMPKKFARKWLLVTKVGAPERGKDISREDAIAEGVTYVEHIDEGGHWESVGIQTDTAIEAFTNLLTSIYGDDALKKWYFPITFEKIETPK